MVRRKKATATVVMMTSMAAMIIGGCAETAAPPAETTAGKPVVCVANYPLQYFTERIGGDAVDVCFPAAAAEDPAFWQPDAEEIAAYQSADLIVLNGATYAKWVATASLPASRMVDTAASFGDALIHVEGSPTHSHGPTGAYAHAGTASTTWLDFRQAIAHAQAIHDALARLLPEKEATFAANLAALRDDLGDLDERMMAIAEKLGDAPLVASQPAYQYWARRYGLDIMAVMWEPAVVPDAESVSGLRTILAEHPARFMIWAGAPDPRSVQLLEALDVQSVVFDPCGNAPEDGDFLSAMQANLVNLRRAFARE